MLLLKIFLLQTVIFGVVIYILWKMMVQSTDTAVNRLDESYQEMAKKKEELEARLSEVEQEYEKRKKEGERIALQLKDEAEKEMYEKKDELIRRAKEEAERIVAETTALKNKMREDIRTEELLKITDICGDLLGNILSERIQAKMDAILIEEFISEINEIDTSHVPAAVEEIEVVTKDSLSEELRKKLIRILTEKMGKPPKLKEDVDRGIIGGIIVKFGSLVLDGSISGKLRDSVVAKKRQIEEGS